MKTFFILKNTLIFATSLFLTSLTSFFTNLETTIKILLLLIIIDFVCGLIKSVYNRTLDSRVCAVGILKKVLIIMIVVLASIIDKLLIENNINIELVRNYVVMFYIVNEGISVVENVGQFAPIPDKIKKILIQLKDKNFDEADK